MSKTRIAVLVSGSGTNLQALIDAEKNGVIQNGEIVVVISNKKGVYALERAGSAGLQKIVIESAGKSRDIFEEELFLALDSYSVELIVLAGFMRVLSKKFISHYVDRIINVHPSLIPSFCGDGFYGLHVHEAALSYGVKVTGATVHFVNEITDGGKIILQKAVDIVDGDTPETLQKRVMREAEWIILPRAVEMISKNISDEKEKK